MFSKFLSEDLGSSCSCGGEIVVVAFTVVVSNVAVSTVVVSTVVVGTVVAATVVVTTVVVVSCSSSSVTVFTTLSLSVAGAGSDLTVLSETLDSSSVFLLMTSLITFLLLFGFSMIICSLIGLKLKYFH